MVTNWHPNVHDQCNFWKICDVFFIISTRRTVLILFTLPHDLYRVCGTRLRNVSFIIFVVSSSRTSCTDIKIKKIHSEQEFSTLPQTDTNFEIEQLHHRWCFYTLATGSSDSESIGSMYNNVNGAANAFASTFKHCMTLRYMCIVEKEEVY